MNTISRRKFLYASGALAGVASFSSVWGLNFKKRSLLAFSTLGCPDWDFHKIVNFAVDNGYQGIEVRGLLREMDLTKSPLFATPQSRKNAVSLMKEKELRFCGLGSSAMLHMAAPAERNKNLEEAKRFIDLAHEINCPYVRVFPNKLPKDQEKNQTMDLIVGGLRELGSHAKGSKVSVLLESHGDLIYSEDLEVIMHAAASAQVGLIWDIANCWSVTKEPPSLVYKRLKEYIRHTHLKDGKLGDKGLDYTLFGQGDVPLAEAIRALIAGGYKGYYSFEWEKLWHPEILEPEVALADFPKSIQRYFK